MLHPDLCPPLPPPTFEGGIMKLNGSGDKGVLQSVGFEEHPVAERALLVADDSVQRMADVVQNSQ